LRETFSQEIPMRQDQYTLTAADVQRHVCVRLQRHLQLADHRRQCTPAVLWAILCWAAARISSLAAACAALKDAPCDQAVRDALLASLPDVASLKRRINRALAGDLPKALKRRKQPVAIDLVNIPYYGECYKDKSEIYNGPLKAGTHQSHAYATAYVIHKGCRWTLALSSVAHDRPWEDIVRELLRQVAKTGVRVRYVLLDRGFYSVKVIRYLQAARYPFIMPVIARGRRQSAEQAASGTQAFFCWKRSGWSRYTLTSKEKTKATVTIAVAKVDASKKRRPGSKRRRKGKFLVYALWGLQPPTTTWVRETYKKRFAIETTYRQMNQVRIRTSTRKPVLRLLYVGIALVMRNVWVWLHWEVLAQKRRGGRRVDLTQLPLRALTHWLQSVAESLFGRCDWVPTQRPVPQWLQE
jgi:Transposase DDE domain